MFSSIALNLADHGFYVGVVPHPTDNLVSRKKAYSEPPLNRMWPRLDYVEEVDGGSGWSSHICLDNNVSFMAMHMKKSVYESAAREGGFRGKLEWKYEDLDNNGFRGEWIEQSI